MNKLNLFRKNILEIYLSTALEKLNEGADKQKKEYSNIIETLEYSLSLAKKKKDGLNLLSAIFTPMGSDKNEQHITLKNMIKELEGENK